LEITNANDVLVFSLFIGTAMSISALPVIARTLMDLGIFKTRIGMIIIAAAMFDDLVGWILFSVVSGYDERSSQGIILFHFWPHHIVCSYNAHRRTDSYQTEAIPWAQKNFSWPGSL
jgi:hypothetical protein